MKLIAIAQKQEGLTKTIVTLYREGEVFYVSVEKQDWLLPKREVFLSGSPSYDVAEQTFLEKTKSFDEYMYF